MLKISANDLKYLLKKLIRFVSVKSTIPVLGTVFIRCADGRLVMRSTNLEQSCEIDLPHDGSLDVCAPAKTLAAMVDTLQGEVVMDSPRPGVLSLPPFTLNVLATNDFPPMPKTDTEKADVIEADRFYRAINAVAFAASTEEARPTMRGVFVGGGEMAATDGFRLAVTKAPLALTALVPAPCLAALPQVMTGEMLSVSTGNGVFGVSNGSTTVWSQTIEGQYPQYHAIIPRGVTTKVTVGRLALISAIKRARVTRDEDLRRVWLETGDGVVVVSAQSEQIGAFSDTVDAAVEGPGIKLILNMDYLLDAVGACSGESVTVEANKPNAPVVIREGGMTQVLMPMVEK